jgi:Co/Zn/Cd efflux system component
VGHAPIHVVAATMALWNQTKGSLRTVEENQTWGRRVRITIAILIALSGVFVFREALHRITRPSEAIEGWTMFAIALLGLLANLFQAQLLQGCRCEADIALRQDVSSDITMSVAIIVSAAAIGFGAPPVIDPVLSLLASFWIVWLAISLFRRPHRH